MKKMILEFFRRGLIASGFGPIVLAIIYLILQHHGIVSTLTVKEVALGIFSLSILAFIAGAMNVIYQIEQIPLMIAIFIHGLVLYISYLVTYLINGWLEWGVTPLLVFSIIFIVCYILIWIGIYSFTRKKTEELNMLLKATQEKKDILS